MVWNRVEGYPDEVRTHLRDAFSVNHPPYQVGVSFALGLFLVALPNLGASIVVTAAIGKRFEWANPQALSAAVVVLNPLVKGVVYAASFALGAAFLGPVPGIFSGDVSPFAGPGVLVRLLLGNVIIAVVLAAVGYVVALYGVSAVR